MLRSFGSFMRKIFSVDSSLERSKIVIIDRRTTRQILNMDALVDALSVAGAFEIERVRFETISLKEQIEIVSQSHILIGVHGAALSFIPFAQNVIEFIPCGLTHPAFFRNVANACDVRCVCARMI